MTICRFSRPLLSLAILMLAASEAFPAIVGTNTSAEPLTAERIAMLPLADRTAWTEYLERSRRQRQEDQEFFEREVRSNRITKVTAPKESRSKQWASIRRPSGWFATAEARRVADGILSFQTPAGGWSKNFDMSEKRAPGMTFGPVSISKFQTAGDFKVPDSQWTYIGTIDNEATTMQLHFLAHVATANPNAPEGEPYRAGFQRGIEYILNAQMPNGGWPQVWPLSGDYHDAVTFNDNAFANVLSLLRNVAAGTNEFAFVPPQLRSRAQSAFDRGLACVLNAQVRVNGRLTAWPQQADALTLQPAAARNFEMPSLASSESANIVRFLMKIPQPTPEAIQAIHSAVAWFEKTAIRGKAYRPAKDRGPVLVPEPGAGPLWSRYYEIGTDRPLFGDRDKTIHDVVDDVSEERRIGYSWFGDTPEEALKEYAKWRGRFAQTAPH